MFEKAARYLVLGVVISALLLSACGGNDKEKKKETTPVNLQLSWVHEAEFTGFYVADQDGYYANEGLKVQLMPGGYTEAGYVDPIEQVMSGAADFGVGAEEQLLLARAAGKPLVAISALYQTSPNVFISLAESNIVRPADFVGKRVVVRDDIKVVYYALLKAASVDPASVIEVTDPALFSLDALINGDVDVTPGFVTSEVLQLEQAGHQVNTILVNDYGIEDFQNIIFTTQDTIDKKPDLVTAFLRATLKGYQYAVDNPDKAPELTLKYDPKLDVEFQKLSWARNEPLIRRAGRQMGDIDPEAWQAFYQSMLDQGVLSSLDVNASYTRQFIDAIYKK